MDNLIEYLFNHPIVNLDKQIRFSNLNIVVKENVAEHSEMVANLAIIIATLINKELKKKVLDYKELAYRAVIHDYGESVTCDVTTDVKYSRDDLPKILEEVEISRMKELDLPEDLFNDIIVAKKNDTVEGALVEACDRLNAYFKLIKEFGIQRTLYFKNSVIFCGKITMMNFNTFSDRLNIKTEVVKDIVKSIDNFNNKVSKLENIL